MSSVSLPIYHECVCDRCEQPCRLPGEELHSTEDVLCDQCLFTEAAGIWARLGRPEIAGRFAGLVGAA